MTGKDTKKRAWGEARYSFSAIREDVCRRKALGEPLSRIYRDIRPPMEYRTFCRHAARFETRIDPSPDQAQSPALPESDSTRDHAAQKVIHSDSAATNEPDPVSAAIMAKAAPGTFDRLNRQAAYNPRENTIEELFGVNEVGKSVSGS